MFLELGDELGLLLVALEVRHLFGEFLILAVHVFDLGFIVILLVLVDLSRLFLQLVLQLLDALLLRLPVVIVLFQLSVLLLL